MENPYLGDYECFECDYWKEQDGLCWCCRKTEDILQDEGITYEEFCEAGVCLGQVYPPHITGRG